VVVDKFPSFFPRVHRGGDLPLLSRSSRSMFAVLLTAVACTAPMDAIHKEAENDPKMNDLIQRIRQVP
jgi:hypothetical protein